MKILSVVTLVSPDAAYGGPVRVATNQARALQERGHEVVLAAATRGYEVPPTELDGVPFRGFPTMQLVPGVGFAGLASPRLLGWCRRAADHFDVVHVHLARDLVTLPVATVVRSRHPRLVLQTHGTIDPSTHLLSRPLDVVLTRPVLRSADATLYLNPLEREGLLNVEPKTGGLTPLENGVPTTNVEPAPEPRLEVLFLARLQARKRPLTFIEAIAPLVEQFPQWTFTLVGPDEGEGSAVRRAIDRLATPRVRWEGPIAPEIGAATHRSRRNLRLCPRSMSRSG